MILLTAILVLQQMLINTINVSSWLMLNALVPSSVPESVVSQYKEQFVEWPEISSTTLTNQLFASLKIIRLFLVLFKATSFFFSSNVFY